MRHYIALNRQGVIAYSWRMVPQAEKKRRNQIGGMALTLALICIMITLATRQLRATIHDIDIPCVAEQAVAFLRG